MNPNFQDQAVTDKEPDPMDQNEGSENEMQFSNTEYPELAGLKGSPITVTCQGTATDDGNGNTTIAITPGSCQFETEGPATKAAKDMSQQSYKQPDANAGQSGDDF